MAKKLDYCDECKKFFKISELNEVNKPLGLLMGLISEKKSQKKLYCDRCIKDVTA